MNLANTDPKTLTAFFSKITLGEVPETDCPGPCWIWHGATDGGGSKGGKYGKIKINGRMNRVHRWAYQTFVGKLTVGYDAHHICENTLCVNPLHIQPLRIEEHSRRGPPVNAWDEKVPI